MNDPLVSVFCLAYNHEKYIKDALDGVVNQITTFDYEIIIHDDASTDLTTDIIKEYSNRFGDKIVPIIQTQNQYSKGVSVVDIMSKVARGKYVAFCECDDYWCDTNKLQKQVEFLEKHYEYSACTCMSCFLNCRTGRKNVPFCVKQDVDISFEDIVDWEIRHYQTSSLVLRKQFLKLPKEFYMNGVGDYPRAIYLALNGKIRYISSVMNVYRVFSENSWSVQNVGDKKRMAFNYNNRAKLLERINDYTNGRYREIFLKKYNEEMFYYEIMNENYNKAKKDYKEVYNKLELKQRIKINIKIMLSYLKFE